MPTGMKYGGLMIEIDTESREKPTAYVLLVPNSVHFLQPSTQQFSGLNLVAKIDSYGNPGKVDL